MNINIMLLDVYAKLPTPAWRIPSRLGRTISSSSISVLAKKAQAPSQP